MAQGRYETMPTLLVRSDVAAERQAATSMGEQALFGLAVLERLDEKTKKEKSKASWEQAKRSAAKLYEQRRYQAAPYKAQGDLPPAPPLVLRSRSSAAKRPPASMLEEMEEIPEEEPPAKPTRPAPLQRSAVAVPVHVPQAASVPAGTSGSSGQSSTGKQQIVINING